MIECLTKQRLRKKNIELLRSQKEKDRVEKSQIICNNVFCLPKFTEAKTVFFYASFDGEVETFEMMNKAKNLGKKISLPQIYKNSMSPVFIEYLDKDLEDGPFGIKQPKQTCLTMPFLNEIDVVIVPGVAFDKSNNRLGRGKGFYDRFLQTLPSNVLTIGLAFDFQIINQLPQIEPHDRAVSCVITN